MLPVPSSSLLHVLQTQVIPWVEQYGTANLIVARPTWWEMLKVDLKNGSYLTQKILNSQSVPVRNKRLYLGDAAQVEAHWPQDGLFSRRVPILTIVISGIVSFPLGDYELHCKAGQMILIPPGTPHPDGSQLLVDSHHLSSGARIMFSIMVRGNGVECWLSRFENNRRVPNTTGDSYYCSSVLARQYFESLTEELVLPREQSPLIARGLLLALVATVTREVQHGKQVNMDVALESDLSPHGMNPIEVAEEYIREHLQEELTINLLARRLYMSRSYFTKLFRRQTGKSFSRYVQDCRLEEAKVLLQDTQWSVTRVGEIVGLSASGLRKLFQQHTGLSPGDYRIAARDRE